MRIKNGPMFYLLICIVMICIVFPFFWEFIASIKPAGELFGDRAFNAIVQEPTLDNYNQIFTQRPFLTYLWNSFVVASLTTLYCIIIATFASYAIARLHFKGKSVILGLVLAVSMFPQIATISPIFLFMKSTGLINSYLGLIIPYITFALPLSIWNLTTFFKKIPVDLEEAAKMDGATIMQTIRKVMIPMVIPGIFTTAILVFIAAWNEFLYALTINTEENMKTVPVGVVMFKGQYTVPWGEIAAACIVVTIPLILLVALFQRRITSGITAGAVKE